MRTIKSVREAYRLYKTDRTADTILALVTLLVVFGPMLYRYQQIRRKSGNQRR